jgi:hypothetical protein
MIDIAESPEYTLWPTLAGRTVADISALFLSVAR